MKYIKICPQCDSINNKMPKAGLDIRMTIKDECLDCGFIGNFPETDHVDEFRKKIKNGKNKI